MIKNKAMIALAAAAMLALAGCSQAENGGTDNNKPGSGLPSPTASIQPSQPPAGGAGQPSTGNGADQGAQQPPAGNGANQGAQQPSTGNSAGNKDGGAKHAAQAVTVGELVELAKKGKVPGCEYAAHTALFDDIEQAWGKADTNESAGKGIYAEYRSHGVAFGYNKGMLVFDVRSFDKSLHTIGAADIKKALGKADSETVSGDDRIYMYRVNDQYELKFAVPKKTGKVDHISVYSPQDAKNLMAG
ncbi:YjgB family protein [Paenibacillus sp. NPDC058071]|uniref:YjgB family protein n=1 Tax=Paenibacillus sp. NPDC058071 TaxID=3346326 RepID=UPI0036DBAC5D